MRVVTFAAGAAIGYLFGTKAGRQRYEQIVAGARQLADHPTVVNAQARVKALVDEASRTVQPPSATTQRPVPAPIAAADSPTTSAGDLR